MFPDGLIIPAHTLVCRALHSHPRPGAPRQSDVIGPISGGTILDSYRLMSTPRSHLHASEQRDASRTRSQRQRPSDRSKGNSQTVWKWRIAHRVRLLQRFTQEAAGFAWTPGLLTLLLEELHVEEIVRDLIGDPTTLPRRSYPQIVAVVLAFRHSWRPDDLRTTLRRLRKDDTRKRSPNTFD